MQSQQCAQRWCVFRETEPVASSLFLHFFALQNVKSFMCNQHSNDHNFWKVFNMLKKMTHSSPLFFCIKSSTRIVNTKSSNRCDSSSVWLTTCCHLLPCWLRLCYRPLGQTIEHQPKMDWSAETQATNLDLGMSHGLKNFSSVLCIWTKQD